MMKYFLEKKDRFHRGWLSPIWVTSHTPNLKKLHIFTSEDKTKLTFF